MKKKISWLLVTAVSIAVISFLGCTTHIHTFSDEWTYDDTGHWHTATCEHTDEIADKAEHTFTDWEVLKAATETKEG